MTEHVIESYCIIYSTFPDFESAKSCANMLLQEDLVIYVNCVPKVSAFYLWNDGIVNTSEIVVIIKTIATNTISIFGKIKSIHPSKIPAIFSLPIETAENEYIQWVNDNVQITTETTD